MFATLGCGILFGLIAGASTFMAISEKDSPRPCAIVREPVVQRADLKEAQDKAREEAAKVLASASIEEAILRTKRYMYDQFDEVDAGSLMLATWLAVNGHLADVKVKKNQVSFAQAVKDVDGTRGFRVCVRGTVTTSMKDPLVAGASRGFMTTDSFGEVAFIAAGKAVPGGFEGRFCGVVTGIYSYQPDGTNLRRSTKIVGFFDLPSSETL